MWTFELAPSFLTLSLVSSRILLKNLCVLIRLLIIAGSAILGVRLRLRYRSIAGCEQWTSR